MKNSLLICYKAILAIILSISGASSATINVPVDQPTIQAGIDAAVNGDIVIVADGIYTGDGNRDIDFLGKAIVVMTENGPDYTEIDCEGSETEPHRGFYFQNSESASSELIGFKIHNGYHDHGGAIRIESSSPAISNCNLNNNTATDMTYSGGAISLNNSTSTISNCVINFNTAIGGGGLFFWESDATLINCIVTNNIANPGGGGGIHCHGGNPEIVNCTFANNDGGGWGGGIDYYTGAPTIQNCIVYNNSADNGSGIWCGTSGAIISCSNLYLNGISGRSHSEINCFSSDPLFIDANNGDYRLIYNSPCLPDNNECQLLIGALIGTYGCGDVNDDSEIDILDIVSLINYKYKGGIAPDPLESADVNHDTNVDILDIVHLINFKYKGGDEPDCP
ncbi:MAG: hypothetical protein GY865_19760 [candidate division Zixibacteria bacterium]|nr:hypothetical protein [candidate division Zixibacteria bacterium]